MSLAESDAKLKVLEEFESKNEQLIATSEQHGQNGNGMNEYLETYQEKTDETVIPEASAVEFAGLGAIPKTPLQRYLNQQPKQIASSPQQNKNPAPITQQQHDLTVRGSPQTSTGGGINMTSNDKNFLTVIRRQNDIADLLASQHKQVSLPAREIPVFDGNPLEYQIFMRAFRHGIEEKTNSYQDMLYYLEQYTSGPCRELVRSCLYMDAEPGFKEAKRLLKVHFGNMKIANAYMTKALTWNNIRAEDGKALQSYALFLRGCCTAMRGLQSTEELDLPSNLKLIVSKLPYKLRERWRTAACDILEQRTTRARLQDLVAFIERQANILQDPLFGDIHDPIMQTKTSKTKFPTDTKANRFKSRGSSFATTVSTVSNSRTQHTQEKPLTKVNLDSSAHTDSFCAFCAGKHTLAECQKISAQPHEAKIEFLRDKGLCFGCLKVGHLSKNCKRRMICQNCQARHPTILHIKRPLKTETNLHKAELSSLVAKTEESSISSALVSLGEGEGTGAGKDCILPIVPVRVRVCNGNKSVLTYAFLDPGSTDTFCTENLRRKLNARSRRTEVLLQTMGTEKTVKSYELAGLEVGHVEDDMYLTLPKLYTQDKIPVTRKNILTQADLNKWPYLQEIKVKEIDADVDLLIGVNVPKAMEPWRVINSQENGPYAVRTLLGWVVNGPLNVSTAVEEGAVASVNRISIVHIERLLEGQYAHDFPEKNYEEKAEMSADDRQFMQIASSSAVLKDGHYYLPLPLRDRNISMPNNYQMAEQRTLHLKRKFLKDQVYASEYKDFMSDVIKRGYAEKVPPEDLTPEEGRVWYIPHHGVFHKRKKTLRVVFDCASTFKGTSLNNVLLQGPDLTNSLIGVLLRFRQEPVAIMADVESMFHQVRVNEEDRNFLRFLWWPEGETDKNLEEYRMTVHLFGAVSSPTCANFALQKTAEDNSSTFNGEVSDTVKSNFYVDDCLKSVPTERQAISLVKNLKEMCSLGGFKLTKWVSNSRTVLASIPENDRAKQIKNLDLDREKLPPDRALGLYWNIENDVFSFHVTANNKIPTRRNILALVSSVYDPLGFLAPFILKARQILQELCKARYGWDEVIPADLLKPWLQWLKELDKLDRFHISRCTKPKNFGRVKNAQLHNFCDASEQGCGTASYLRLTNDSEEVHVSFVMGKSRVTPLKTVTIPRLELTAATLASRIDRMLHAELKIQLQESIFWTDSQSVLKYLRNKTRRFRTFVANRISVIQNMSKVSQWRFIDSKHNPADDASRGLRIEPFLSSKTWLHGPKFLENPESEWPRNPKELDPVLPDDPEVKKTSHCE